MRHLPPILIFFLVAWEQLFFSSYLCISLSGYNIHQKLFRNSNKQVIKVLATWQQPKQALIRSQGESICRSCHTRFALFFRFHTSLNVCLASCPWLTDESNIYRPAVVSAATWGKYAALWPLNAFWCSPATSQPTTAPHGRLERVSRVWLKTPNGLSWKMVNRDFYI